VSTSLELVDAAEAAPRAASATDPPRLALVDPSRLRRDCLTLAVRGEGWRVTDMPAVRDLLRRLARGENFDAVLIDGASGVDRNVEEVARLAPRLPILVAAECENGRQAKRLLAAGARDVLPANASLRMLMSALADIRGSTSLSPDWAAPSTASRPCALTRRQREVLALISEGKSNRMIAASLAVSEETVKVHVKQIIRRLKVANRTQAALVAAGARRPGGPVSPPPSPAEVL
jgi:two-component system nitrate/nitrite response regulator NarL